MITGENRYCGKFVHFDRGRCAYTCGVTGRVMTLMIKLFLENEFLIISSLNCLGHKSSFVCYESKTSLSTNVGELK